MSVASTVQQVYEGLRDRLADVAPAAELWLQAELVAEIEELKREHRAVVLGHNYMEPALYHTICDIRGDSLALAREARDSRAEVLVVCGVEFMAETAKILSPEKRVLIPSQRAGCSLAASIDADDVRALKRWYPGVPVVTYVNTSAEVKAESDVCCTSGNAHRVVAALGSERVIFLPDEYLARNVAHALKKEVIVLDRGGVAKSYQPAEGNVLAWAGRCEVHERFSVDDVEEIRQQVPGVAVLAHPECSREVCASADFSGSTAEMIGFVHKNPGRKIFLATECSMADNIVAESPESDLVRLCSKRCPHMAQVTLEMTRDALKYGRFEVEVPADISRRARRALDRMLEY